MVNFLLYILKVFFIGLTTGILSGASGIGGALISTIAIRMLLNTPAIVAVETTLPVIIPTAATGGFIYYRNKLVDKEAVVWCIVPGAIASIVGAFITKYIPGYILLLATAVILFYLSIAMFFGSRNGEKKNQESKESPFSSKKRKISFFIIGFIAGLFAGLLGIGGGSVLIPAFTLYMKMPLKKAAGSSLLVIAALAIPGSIMHYLLHHINLAIAGLLTLGVIPGSYFGAKFSIKLRKIKLLYYFVAILLMAVSLYFAYQEFLLAKLIF